MFSFDRQQERLSLSNFSGSPSNMEGRSGNMSDVISEPLPIISQGIYFGHGTPISGLRSPCGKDAKNRSPIVEAPSPFTRPHLLLSIHSKLSGYSSPGHLSRLFSVAEEATTAETHECFVIQHKGDSDRLSTSCTMSRSEIHPSGNHMSRSHDHAKDATWPGGSNRRSEDSRFQEGPNSPPPTLSSSGPLWRFHSEASPSRSGSWRSEAALDPRTASAGMVPAGVDGARSCRDSPRVSGALKKPHGNSSALVSTFYQMLHKCCTTLKTYLCPFVLSTYFTCYGHITDASV